MQFQIVGNSGLFKILRANFHEELPQNQPGYSKYLVSQPLRPHAGFQGGPLRGSIGHGRVQINSSNNPVSQAVKGTGVFHGVLSYAEMKFTQEKMNCDATLPFSNDDVYEGQIQNGIPHGQGSLTYRDTATYVGNFENGYAHGQGTLKYSDGSYYIGCFEMGMPHGQGMHSLLSGEIYQGQFKRGMPQGQGKLTYPSGICFNGSFVDGKPFGQEYIDWLYKGVYKSKL